MKKSRNIFILILIIFIISLPGCSFKNSPEKKPSSSNKEEKTKPPIELKKITDELDMIIAELDKKFKAQKMPAMFKDIQLDPKDQEKNEPDKDEQTEEKPSNEKDEQAKGNKNNQQSEKNQSNDKEKEQSKEKESKQGESAGEQSKAKNTQPQEAQQQKPATDWQKEFNSLKKIHSAWNTVLPEALKAGLSENSRQQIENSLEKLTQEINKQNLENSLSAALMLHKNSIDLTKIFSKSESAQFYQVKYETMNAIFEASRNDWEVANQEISIAKEHWDNFSKQIKEVDLKILNRTDLAISDLEKAIKSNQLELVIIKGEIAMKNLNKLQKDIAKESSSGA